MDKEFEKKKLALLQLANVVAVGVGDGLLEVSVSRKLAKSDARLKKRDIIPESVTYKGNPLYTNVKQTGVIRALEDPGRYRPAPGGVSVGHFAISAGTLGMWVNRDGKKHILSNNHVLADVNDGVIGDAVLQPGPHDGGTISNDLLARLTDFVPIEFLDPSGGCPFANSAVTVLNALAKLFGSRYRIPPPIKPFANPNVVDCALAEVVDVKDVDDQILTIGKTVGTAEGTLGLAVQKHGRTTGYNQSSITQTEVTTAVQYGSGLTAMFADQLIVENPPMLEPGDSGSILVDMKNHVIGLGFAGSDTVSIFNRIQNVEEGLRITI